MLDTISLVRYVIASFRRKRGNPLLRAKCGNHHVFFIKGMTRRGGE